MVRTLLIVNRDVPAEPILSFLSKQNDVIWALKQRDQGAQADASTHLAPEFSTEYILMHRPEFWVLEAGLAETLLRQAGD